MNRLVWSCAMSMMLSCGGEDGSGLASSKLLVELSAPERSQLCEWSADVSDAPRTVMCGADAFEYPTAEDCAAAFASLSTQCTATVASAEACTEAQNDMPCEFDVQACGWLITCL